MGIKRMWAGLPRAARIYVAVLGALGVGIVALLVTVAAAGTPLLAATSPSPSPGAGSAGSAYCDRFTGHLASNLGKSQDQVKKAISDAIGQTLNDAVKNGDLTQKQADAVKSRLSSNSNGQACAGLGARFGKQPGAAMGRGGLRGLTADVATALGISESELQQDLRSGKSVKDIATSKGLDENAFRAKLVSAVKADLDKQVAAGSITQKQEDAALARLQNGPLPLWDAAPRKGMPGRQQPGTPPTSPSTTTSNG